MALEPPPRPGDGFPYTLGAHRVEIQRAIANIPIGRPVVVTVVVGPPTRGMSYFVRCGTPKIMFSSTTSVNTTVPILRLIEDDRERMHDVEPAVAEMNTLMRTSQCRAATIDAIEKYPMVGLRAVVTLNRVRTCGIGRGG